MSHLIVPSANKNAVLPVLCASLLTDELGSSVEMDFARGTLKMQHGSRQGAGGARLPAGMRSSIMPVPAARTCRSMACSNWAAPSTASMTTSTRWPPFSR